MGNFLKDFFTDFSMNKTAKNSNKTEIREEVEDAYTFIQMAYKIKKSRELNTFEKTLNCLTTVTVIRYLKDTPDEEILTMHYGMKPYPKKVQEAMIEMLQDNPELFKRMKSYVTLGDVENAKEVLDLATKVAAKP